MPGEYDPRRYGPTASTAEARTRSLSVCASTPREVLVRAEEEKHLLFARTLRRYDDDRRQSKLFEQQRCAGFGSKPTTSTRVAVTSRLLSSVHLDAFPSDSRFGKPGGSRPASTARSSGTTMFASPETAPTRFHRQHAKHASTNNDECVNDSDTPASTPTTCLGSTASSATAFIGRGSYSDATDPERRGRTRRRSLSWRCRRNAAQSRWLPGSACSFCCDSTPAANASKLDRSGSSNSSSGSRRRSISSSTSTNRGRNRRRNFSTTPRQSEPSSSESKGYCVGGDHGSGGTAGGGRRAGRGHSGRSVGEAGVRRDDSIDAEELFRRKNRMTNYNVTYRRWAESYDRSTSRRIALERRERLETGREVHIRRQRAKHEFQKWMRSHAPRSASAAAVAALPAGASHAGGGGGSGGGLGPRSSYRERAASASPLRQTLAGKRKESWTAGGFERAGVFRDSVASNTSVEELERAKEAERIKEEKTREVDRAFRAWLDRKKKQAHADREARKEREEALARRRKLEASRRWKKRHVVCAYTYGAKVGARDWKEEDESGGTGEKKEEARAQQEEDNQTGEQEKQRR